MFLSILSFSILIFSIETLSAFTYVFRYWSPFHFFNYLSYLYRLWIIPLEDIIGNIFNFTVVIMVRGWVVKHGVPLVVHSLIIPSYLSFKETFDFAAWMYDYQEYYFNHCFSKSLASYMICFEARSEFRALKIDIRV